MELSKVTMILRGYTYEQVRCVAEVLINSSYVKNMEITLNTSNAYEIIKKIADEFQGRLHIGAGTVQTYDCLLYTSGMLRSSRDCMMNSAGNGF